MCKLIYRGSLNIKRAVIGVAKGLLLPCCFRLRVSFHKADGHLEATGLGVKITLSLWNWIGALFAVLLKAPNKLRISYRCYYVWFTQWSSNYSLRNGFITENTYRHTVPSGCEINAVVLFIILILFMYGQFLLFIRLRVIDQLTCRYIIKPLIASWFCLVI